MARLGVITGLHAEAEILAGAVSRTGAVIEIRCAGASARRAREHAAALAVSGVDGLLSFGVAGGLDPAFGPGSLLAPTAVTATDGAKIRCDPAWRERFAALMAGAETVLSAEILGSEDMISNPGAKRSIFEASGAGAVDMESLAVAEAASAAGLPFLAVRTIADPAGRAPPQAALSAVAPDGRIRMIAAVASLARNPASLPLYLSLARDSRAALNALRRVAARGAPLFGLL